MNDIQKKIYIDKEKKNKKKYDGDYGLFTCTFFMRPSSLGGGRILRRTLSVSLSVCPSVRLSVRPVSGCCFVILQQNRLTSEHPK